MSAGQRWEAGQAIRERIVGPITRTHIVRYAGAGGDFNPIHHDEPFARAAGYPGVFAHGMLTAGILGAHMAAWLGSGWVERFSARFVGQVWPGDELVLGGGIETVETLAEGLRVHAALTVHRCAAGVAPQLVLTGRVTARVAEVVR